MFINVYLNKSIKNKTYSSKRIYTNICSKMSMNKNYKLILYSENSILFNLYTNVMSSKTTKNYFRKHILDSLSLVPFINSFYLRNTNCNIIDIGSGSGIPGIIISISFLNFFSILIDSVMKKTVFQKKIKNILSIKNFFPLCARIEKLKTIKGKIKINFIFSRAFSDLKSSMLYISDLDEKFTKSLFLKKIESSNIEFSSSLEYLNDFKYKIKVLVKIDKKSKGRMLVIIENSIH